MIELFNADGVPSLFKNEGAQRRPSESSDSSKLV